MFAELFLFMKHATNILVSFFWLFLAYNLYRNIDFFELYFYSTPLVSFRTASVLVRFFVAFCLTIPLLIVLNPFVKKGNVIWVSIPLAAGISFFISQLIPNTYVCNCFLKEILNGKFIFELIFLSLSIVSLILVFFKKPNEKKGLNYRNGFFSIFSIAIVTVVFIINAPDFFLYKKPLKKFDVVPYKTLKQKSADIFTELKVNDQYQTVCLFNPGCPFCQRASIKLSLMANKNNFTENVTYLFSGNPSSIPLFMEKYQIENIQSGHMNGEDLLHLSKGTIPTVLIIKNDTIYYTFGYRDMNESIFKEIYF